MRMMIEVASGEMVLRGLYRDHGKTVMGIKDWLSTGGSSGAIAV